MIDLIKEIEKNKRSKGRYADEFVYGFNEGIEKVLGILDQYNIITAHKTIKLSEIVERLKNSFDCYTTECKLYREQNKIEVEYYYYSYVECLSSGYIVIINNKIEILVADTSTDIHKWIYTLWIAGTEIVDDLEENENE